MGEGVGGKVKGQHEWVMFGMGGVDAWCTDRLMDGMSGWMAGKGRWMGGWDVWWMDRMDDEWDERMGGWMDG